MGGACGHQVAGGGGEGVRDVGVVIGRHRVGHVDDDVDAFQRISQTALYPRKCRSNKILGARSSDSPHPGLDQVRPAGLC